MRRIIIVAIIFILARLCIFDALADIGDDIPPVVHIYDVSWTEVDSITVQTGETFILYGVATGNQPMNYFWYDEELVGTGNTLSYSIDTESDHIILLEVIDVNGLSGFDSVLVTAMDPAVSNHDATWGNIKSLFR